MKLKFKQKKQESDGVKTFIFTPDKAFTWTAGQSMLFEIPTEIGIEERWFTISSAPFERHVAITTRISQSRFKYALDNLAMGETIHASGLNGDFIWTEDDERKAFIAGGIGITPFRSMLMQCHHERKRLDVHLMYISGDETIVFKDELADLCASHPELVVTYASAMPADIFACLGETSVRGAIYISGPEPMVDDVGGSLEAAGVPVERLMRDWFSGYDVRAV